VVGSCNHGIKDKLAVSILPHEATAQLELFYL